MHKNNTPIYLALAVVIGILIGSFFNNNNTSLGVKPSNEQKIRRLINFIETDYVDNIDTDNLLDEAITKMLTKLDPHSVYIPKQELQAITENMQGNFVGIGIKFRMEKDSITVIQPMKGGPSIKMGIKAGDRILMADGDTLYNKKLTSTDVFKALKGKPNTSVNLQVYRKTTDSLFTITIPRKKVNIKSVEISYMLSDSIGYIKLDRFAQNTYKEFESSLQNLLDKGMTSLVLDLRGNGGGFIHIAHKIIDEFLEDEKLVVFTKNNKGQTNKLFATEKGRFEEGKLYVLIDENSASASEIVAGALQDNDKGTIIGRRSFGKGLVQEEMDLGDGSAVRLTTARYFTPSGRSIQKPYKKGNYSGEVSQRYTKGELFTKDSIKVNDSLQFVTPKGKVVYGGGGIIPDIFIPLDSSRYVNTVYFSVLKDFSFSYVDTNRQKLSEFTTDDFIKYLNSNKTIRTNFYKKIKKYNPDWKTRKKLYHYLKQYMVRELFGEEELYKIELKDDTMIQKVFELERNE